MRNKEAHVHYGDSLNFGIEHSQLEAMEGEIQRLKSQISRMENANEVLWNTSVMKIIFKNEIVARKYRTKVENFLKSTLEKGEDFIVNCEIQNNTEQEFEEVPQAFHIDKNYQFLQQEKSSKTVPHYSSTFEDILHCDEPEVEEKGEEKSQGLTCFNCLGNHHMKNCPDKLDRSRISANKKDILVGGSNIRYHIEEQKGLMKPGCLSDTLMNALGLNSDQLPSFIYHMRILGYPPGWMAEAVFETSGLSLYDTEGKATEDRSLVPGKGTVYDGEKFIDYPGFNSPIPKGFKDEWKSLKMPPLQPHQQLTEALKAPNTLFYQNGINMIKRKKLKLPMPKNEIKRVRIGAEVESNSYSDWANQCHSTPKPNIKFNNGSPYASTNPEKSRHSFSISKSPGTPILKQGNPYNKLPDADKFAQGITEHLPFENLPDAVGSFEKMRGVLSSLQKKMSEINHS